MRDENNFKKKTYEQAVRLRRIGNRAVQKAQHENRRLNIPNAYSHRGKLCFELPNGELTFKNPFSIVSISSPNVCIHRKVLRDI